MQQEQFEKACEIYDLVWNLRLREADDEVKVLIKKHPLFALIHTEIAVIRYLLTERKDEYVEAQKRLTNTRKGCSQLFHLRKPAVKAYLSRKGVDSTIPEKKDIRDEDSDDESAGSSEQIVDADMETIARQSANCLWARAIGAETAFMDSALKFKNFKYVKGVLDFRKSWKTYEECDIILTRLCNEQGTNNDIPQFDFIRCMSDFGVGVFHFACSTIPRSFQWIVEGIGFKADRTQSIMELSRSSNVKFFRSRLSSISLAWIKTFFYFDYASCNQILDRLKEDYPASPIVNFVVGYIQRKQGLLESSSAQFSSCIEHAAELPEFQEKVEYELGYNCYLQLRWDEAAKYLEKFYRSKVSEQFRAYCAFQVGFCYLMMGDNNKAMNYMKTVEKYVRKNYAFDEYGGKQAKKFLKGKGFSPYEVEFIQALLLHESCNYSRCLEKCEEMKALEKTVTDNCRTLYLVGSCNAQLKNIEQAKEAYTAVVTKTKTIKEQKKEIFVLPWSFTGLAEIHIIEEDLEKAEAALKRAKSYSAFDFESFLTWRLRKAEDDARKLAVKLGAAQE